MSRSLAAVFAHPDDETFAMGGTIALHARRGDPFALYCATDGGAGRSSGVEVSSPEQLGALRRRELDAALDVLGARTDVVFGGHPDGRLPEADADALVGEVVRFLRTARPAVVVTFGPEGAPTGHRDHRAICRAATAAFFLAARASEYPEQLAAGLAPHGARRLYYVSWAEPAPGSPIRHQSVPATASLDTRTTHDVELRAFHAHRTQRAHEEAFRRDCLTSTEDYALVAGAPQPAPLVADLFAGLA